LKQKPLLNLLIQLFPDASKQTLYSRIMCGEVIVNGERNRDPKKPISPDASITFLEKRYVSRGGVKLEYALRHSDFSVEGKVVLDAGASTGGFTDCVLQHGAIRVHAVDVGTNQLAYSLRADPRVITNEKTNIMAPISFEPRPDVAVADISFRSLRGAAARILELTLDSRALVLAKPQFEWPKDDASFRGVLTNPSDIRDVLRNLTEDLSAEDVYVHDVIPSPITGRKGNREFFLLVDGCEARDLDEVFHLIDAAIQA
jgi:23S rRNA (cytidine1920-2'-O)/16S rRNA (cytidine1409-2'-O)-methyltransferase